MTPSARLSAAIEILADIETRRRPAADVLKDWGLSHRFAGSSDRAGIAGLVYDALRRRASSGWLMGEASPRAVLLGMLHRERGLDVAAIAALCSGERFAPAPLSEAEQAALLDRAVALTKPNGRIAYITCSVLNEENGDQVRDFLGRNPDFSVEKPAEVAQALGERAYLFTRAALISEAGLLMTPRRTDTDGFFVSLLRRNG